MKFKLALLLTIVAFSLVGFLLLTNHWGVAIKISNYIFYFLVVVVIWKTIK